jgi:hypothetical protein
VKYYSQYSVARRARVRSALFVLVKYCVSVTVLTVLDECNGPLSPECNGPSEYCQERNDRTEQGR